KKPKDPNAPKGPKSSYIHFSMAKRPEVLAEDSSLTMGDISKKIGALWKELSEEEKAPYIEAAKVEKDAYTVALAAYKATLLAEGDGNTPDDDEGEDEGEALAVASQPRRGRPAITAVIGGAKGKKKAAQKKPAVSGSDDLSDDSSDGSSDAKTKKVAAAKAAAAKKAAGPPLCAGGSTAVAVAAKRPGRPPLSATAKAAAKKKRDERDDGANAFATSDFACVDSPPGHRRRPEGPP
ncbi:high mobility group box domain-containing protein, partial [Pelagophyceae sp. CCMP2097]